jgi:hypothetical protein
MDDHDHCDHDPIECSYDALVGEYREVVAERDRLRAVVDAVRALVEEAGPWPAADLGTEQYNRLMVALTQLDYYDGDRERTVTPETLGETDG